MGGEGSCDVRQNIRFKGVGVVRGLLLGAFKYYQVIDEGRTS